MHILAQAVQTIPDPAFNQLATLSGVIVATGLIVEVLKRILGDTPIWRKTPTWLIATFVAVGTTFFANRVVGVLDGDFMSLAWSAVISAATASGFFTWLRGDAGSVPGRVSMLIMIPLLSITLTGCNQSISQQYRTASDSYSTTLNTLAALARADRINNDDIDKIDEYRNRINIMLDQMEVAVKHNDIKLYNTLGEKLDVLLAILEGFLLPTESTHHDRTRSDYVSEGSYHYRFSYYGYSYKRYGRESRFNSGRDRAGNAAETRCKYTVGGYHGRRLNTAA